MPKQLCMSVVVELPDDYFESHRVGLELSGPWLALVEAAKATGRRYETKVDEIEVRAKQQRAPRKPRVVAPASEAA